ncbi:MAG: 4Fe-4S dicluster domain-containing protein, partial [Deltaproteobacteria bacterium]
MKTIHKARIKDLLREVNKEWTTYVPQRNVGGDIWYEALPKNEKELDGALKSIALEDEEVVISPKDIFFPQLECMFRFEEHKIQEVVESSPKFVFGSKACDLAGVLFSDDFFKRGFGDKYYLSRIQDRFLVVIGCLNPPRPRACFCTSAKTGPFAENGFDWQLVDNGDSYFVETGSQIGEDLLEKYGEFFKDPPADAEETIDYIKRKAYEAVELRVNFQRALDLMGDDQFSPEETYRRIGERCIYCGACLYVCPTCTCFNVFDYLKWGQGARYRGWDACVFQGYTR